MTESDVNVLEIPEADEDRINMDKENIPHQIITNVSSWKAWYECKITYDGRYRCNKYTRNEVQR